MRTWIFLPLFFTLFVNPEDHSQESTGAIIWDFEVLPQNSSAAVVQASKIQETKAIDAYCLKTFNGWAKSKNGLCEMFHS